MDPLSVQLYRFRPGRFGATKAGSMADEAGAPVPPASTPEKAPRPQSAKKIADQQLHQALVDETERSSTREKVLKVFKKQSRALPTASDEAGSTPTKPEARKAEEVRSMLKQHRMEVEPLWDRDAEEEWFRDDPVTPSAAQQPVEDESPSVPRPAPTDNFIPMYGVHIDNFWVGTSRAMLAIVYALVVALSVIVLWQMIEQGSERHMMGWAIGAVFVAVTLPLSLNDIHMHIIHYVSPLQRHYVRILWMVPIYSVESWLALRFNDQKLVLETMREAYESFVVYSFFQLMKEFLGPKDVSHPPFASSRFALPRTQLQQLPGRAQGTRRVENAFALLLDAVPSRWFSVCWLAM